MIRRETINEEKDKLNSPISITQNKFIVKHSPTKKTTDIFTGNFTKYLRKTYYPFYANSFRNRRGKNIS